MPEQENTLLYSQTGMEWPVGFLMVVCKHKLNFNSWIPMLSFELYSQKVNSGWLPSEYDIQVGGFKDYYKLPTHLQGCQQERTVPPECLRSPSTSVSHSWADSSGSWIEPRSLSAQRQWFDPDTHVLGSEVFHMIYWFTYQLTCLIISGCTMAHKLLLSQSV